MAVKPLIAEREIEHLNHATKLVDEERRRWYRALEAVGLSNLEGLAPEMVAAEVASLTARIVELKSEIETMRYEAKESEERASAETP